MAIEALHMRGIDPKVEQIIDEAGRMSHLTYLKGEERKKCNAFNSFSTWSFYENAAKFFASDFDEGYGWCARFRKGDLVESSNESWKYGIVKGIVTEWNSGVEPNCFCLEVSIKNGRTDTVFWRRLKDGTVRLANLPPEIMELAKSQVESMCPLLNKEST